MINSNAHKPGFKHTPLGWIPEDWDVKPLGQLGKPFIGLTYTPDDVCDDQSGTLVLRSSNVQQGNLAYNDNVYVSCNIPERATAREGDILVCVRNGSRSLIGKSALIDANADGMAFGAFMSIFRSPLNYYLHHVFKSATFQREINKNIGATINQITSADMLTFVVAMPRSTRECVKIATILSTWDEAIQKTQQLIEQLKQRNKGLMQQLLTGKKRLKGFSGKWGTVRLADVTAKISRRNKNLINATVYSVTNTHGFVPQADHFEREIADGDLSTYKIVKSNEFAYNPARINVGSIGYFTDAVGIISSLYVCFKTTEGILDSYLWHLLDLDHTKYKIESMGEGGVRIYLWYELFAAIKVLLPPTEEQEAIVKVLDEADNELKLYEQQFTNLQEQKKGLMQKLLSGEVRVKINN